MEIEKKLREEIESLVKDYFEKVHYEQNFVPHISKVPVTGKVLFKEDLVNLVNSSLDMWLTAGEYTTSFEKSIWVIPEEDFLNWFISLYPSSGS